MNRMFLCWSRTVKSGVNHGLYLFLVLHFLNGACLFKIGRKLLIRNNQASSTDGMRSILGPGRLERPARRSVLQFDSDEGWSFDRGPIMDTGNEAVIAEILVENSRGVFRGQVGQDDVYEGAHVYRFDARDTQLV